MAGTGLKAYIRINDARVRTGNVDKPFASQQYLCGCRIIGSNISVRRDNNFYNEKGYIQDEKEIIKSSFKFSKNQEIAFIITKLIINAKEGDRIQFAIIFLIRSSFTVFIPFDIPTPLIPPIMQ